MQKLYIKHLGPIEECEINIEEFKDLLIIKMKR